MLEISADDQVCTASAETPLLDIWAALPIGLYPPFPPVELPGGLGGLVTRGGFAQTFFFGAEVLGLSFRAPSGRLIRAGGRVVKNVQGYDLTRPFVGSFGLLGEAQQVTVRLRPGLGYAHHARPGTLDQPPEALPRFLWQDGSMLHAVHFGHVREVERVMAAFGGEPVDGSLDYRAAFPAGMGVGEHGPLWDLRYRWADGREAPEVPALFRKVAAAL
ncbi:FAD-binding oxidoreductase [Deinococcus sonorensis]|uniref:DUF5639 domain-containing protein n=2 Tax=Deinococcus sonorensis TaxID=309891 RepID=A0AAU7U7K4_9DEIO